MMVRNAIKATLEDDCSELTRSEELNPWMMAKLKEEYHGRINNYISNSKKSKNVTVSPNFF